MELLWTISHDKHLPNEIIDQALAAHLKILDYSCLLVSKTVFYLLRRTMIDETHLLRTKTHLQRTETHPREPKPISRGLKLISGEPKPISGEANSIAEESLLFRPTHYREQNNEKFV